jgi:short-subunit dehydrogenase
MPAATVASCGHRAFRKGKPLAIPGWQYRVLLLLVRIMPRRFVRKMAERFNDTKE